MKRTGDDWIKGEPPAGITLAWMCIDHGDSEECLLVGNYRKGTISKSVRGKITHWKPVTF